MKLAQIVVLDDFGAVQFEGSLLTFLRANKEDEYFCDDLLADLRQGMMQSPPEPAVIGGGASPVSFVSMLE